MSMKFNVLVVDDMSTTRRILVTLTKDIGFARIDEAENGSVAWDLLQKNDYGLVLCDYFMPEMDGLDLLIKVRADARLGKLPFIMVTSADDRESIVKIVQAKVSQFVVKPFTAQTLRDKIDKVLLPQ